MAAFNKILLTGIDGQVGHVLYPKLQRLGKVIALNRHQLDLSRPDHIRDVVQQIKPDLIINPAAYTAVDKAESESELAYAINGIAPGILAEEAAKINALLVHYSTDYVFDGAKPTPYLETDKPNPLSVYGKSKLLGEKAIQDIGSAHLIFRTSWIYGNHGSNFYKTILKLAMQKNNLKIVADQLGAPTHSIALAKASVGIIQRFNPHDSGLYHLSNAGKTSWHIFAKTIIQQYLVLQPSKNWPILKLATDGLIPIAAINYPVKALRPSNSLLSNERIAQQFNISLTDWEDELYLAMNALTLHDLT